MHVIGTAGHVDHGKSTLVKAITGIDPDRLREEKERGMTIDLGFAWLRLPSGREASIVDVPGHERFIKNMLAGVGGIDLGLLVIAADEGRMPQTEEHLDILDLLQVRRVVVALTKCDLVEPEWLDLVTTDVRERLGPTHYPDAPLVPVSSITGAGLSDLAETLDQALRNTPARPDLGRPRLPIDRVFTIAGFGTVLTGTLIGGTLRLNQELVIEPGHLRVRVRGLQTHRQKVEVAEPGSRVAVNVVGVSVDDVRRGQVLTVAGWLEPSIAVDARVRVLGSAPPLQHNALVSFHSGSDEAMARVGVLESDAIQPNGEGWVQLRFSEPVAVSRGDLFIVRSPNATIAGGEIVQTGAKRHRRRHPPTIERLETLRRGSPEEMIVQTVAVRRFATVAEVTQLVDAPATDARRLIDDFVDRGVLVRLGDHLAAPAFVEDLGRQAVALVGAFHEQFPLRDGMPREEVKSRLGLSPKQFASLSDRLVARGWLVADDSLLRLSEHEVTFDEIQEAKARQLVEALSERPFSPPDFGEITATLGIDAELANAIVGREGFVRVSDSIVFTSDAFEAMRQRVVAHIREHGAMTVAEVRDLFDTSRKYALALMEFFDQIRVTRRVGDNRVLR